MSREVAFNALFSVISAAYDWGVASRRFKMWAEVPPSQRPAFFQLESGVETYEWATIVIPRRTIEARLCLYFDSRDQSAPGATQINNALDAIDKALMPTGADMQKGRQTLGGAVYACKIVGVPVRDVGDVDGDGLAVVDVRLTLP